MLKPVTEVSLLDYYALRSQILSGAIGVGIRDLTLCRDRCSPTNCFR